MASIIREGERDLVDAVTQAGQGARPDAAQVNHDGDAADVDRTVDVCPEMSTGLSGSGDGRRSVVDDRADAVRVCVVDRRGNHGCVRCVDVYVAEVELLVGGRTDVGVPCTVGVLGAVDVCALGSQRCGEGATPVAGDVSLRRPSDAADLCVVLEQGDRRERFCGSREGRGRVGGGGKVCAAGVRRVRWGRDVRKGWCQCGVNGDRLACRANGVPWTAVEKIAVVAIRERGTNGATPGASDNRHVGAEVGWPIGVHGDVGCGRVGRP